MDHPAPNSAKGPLTGVTVLDLTRALAGPFSTLLLAGLGANVIRVEIPERGDGRDSAPFLGKDGTSLRRQHGDDVSIAHLIRHRGKKSITLNLKHGEARRIFSQPRDCLPPWCAGRTSLTPASMCAREASCIA